MDFYREASKDIPLYRRCDVIVCGGGPAGVAAAIASARTGAATQLIELRGCVGGVWTAGLLSWIIDSKNKPGIMQEITERLRARDACTVDEQKFVDFDAEPAYRGKDLERDFSYDAEQMKIVLEEMLLEAGVEIRLHTRVAAAATDDTNRLTWAITESKSGREAWQASVFVDATGDGDLAAQAGCGYDVGHPDTGKVQPMSLICLVSGIHAEEVEPFVTEWHTGLNLPKARLKEEFLRVGVDPSYAKPSLFRIYDDLFALFINHEYGVLGTDAAQLTQATLRARAEIHRAVDALRASGGLWRNLRIIATAEQIGVREARRIHGHHQVTRQDLIDGQKYEDGVARVTFPVDVHALDPKKDKGYSREGVEALPFDIPLRALIARDVDGLMMAGRCISGDFIAHSSYRVSGNAVAMGQAAGITAALAALSDRLPQDVPWAEVSAKLGTISTGSQLSAEVNG